MKTLFLTLLFILYINNIVGVTHGNDFGLENPYQVLIRASGYICGGSLISDRWVLTASHCIYDVNDLSVTVGFVHGSLGSTFFPHKQFIHPAYEPVDNINDIALIMLPRSIQTTFVKLIKKELIEDGTIITISGWGMLGDNKTITSKLQEANLKVINNEKCKDSYREYIDFESAFCAKGENGQNPCSGDSGGPAVIKNSTSLLQVGIISFGPEGCDLGIPAGFTKISVYMDWISNITGIHS